MDTGRERSGSKPAGGSPLGRHRSACYSRSPKRSILCWSCRPGRWPADCRLGTGPPDPSNHPRSVHWRIDRPVGRGCSGAPSRAMAAVILTAAERRVLPVDSRGTQPVRGAKNRPFSNVPDQTLVRQAATFRGNFMAIRPWIDRYPARCQPVIGVCDLLGFAILPSGRRVCNPRHS